MAYKVLVPPGSEPFSLPEARLHLRLDGDDTTEDSLLLGFIAAARDWIEQYTGRAIAEQTVEVAFDRFAPEALRLPGGDVFEIVSVQYLDPAGAEQTLDASRYALDAWSSPSCLRLAFGAAWPDLRATANALRISYVIGAGPLPPSIRAAALLMIGHLYENREESTETQLHAIPMGVKALLAPYRVNLGI